MPEPQQESLLAKLGRQSSQGVSNLLWGLDTPRALIASGIDYFQDGEWNNPLDAERRVSSEQLLDQAGWKSDSTGRWMTGMALDLATDPLTYMTLGGSSLTKAGKAAKAAGLIDNATVAASKRLRSKVLDDAVDQLPVPTFPYRAVGLDDAAAEALTATLPGRAQRTLTALKTNIRDFAEHTTRPLVGKREALRTTTLDEAFKAAPADAQKALKEQLDAYLTRHKLDYDAIKDQPLGKSFGLGFGSASVVGDPLGATAGAALARGADRVGEAIRWSTPGLYAHGLFNKAAGGQTDAAAQAASLRINQTADISEAKGRREAAEMADMLRVAEIKPEVAARTGINDVMSAKAGEAIDRYLEKNAATAADIDFVENTPGVRAFVDRWGHLAPKILTESEEMGLRAHQLQHNYGAGYRPYQLEHVLDRVVGKKSKQPALFDTVTGDMLARSKALQLPGGIDQLRQLSTDTRFVGLGKAFKEDDVADLLYKEINNPSSPYYVAMADSPVGQAAAKEAADRAAASAAWASGTMSTAAAKKAAAVPAARYSKAKARELARFLNRLEVPADGKLAPAFGNHPLEATTRYVYGRKRAIGTADELINTIASRLVNQTPGQVEGGKHISALSALQKAGLKSPKTVLDDGTKVRGGAAAELRKRMAEILGEAGEVVTPENIDLSQYSIPIETLNQLTRMHDVFASPKAVGQIGNLVEQYTKMFKAGVLTWPSRYTRDLTSGFISNVIEAGPEAVKGGYHAAKLLNGQYEKVIPYLKKMPLYAAASKAGLSDEELLSKFLADTAEAGILKGGAIVDRTNADRTAEAVKELLPGFKPQSIRGSFAGDPSRTYGQFAKQAINPLGVKGVLGNKDTTNPLYKTGEKLGDWTDSVNRMGGFMALLQKGIAPKEAARRMIAAHVDYGNLSEVEKTIRKWMPFYAYESRILKYAAGKIASKPGGAYTQMLRLADKAQQSDDETYVPQTMREQSGFLLPKELGQLTEALGLGNVAEPGPGLRRAITNIDLPGLSALNRVSVAKTGGKFDLNASLISTIQNYAQQLGPLPKTAIEAATQQDMFTKRKLGEVPSEIDTIVGALTGDEDFRLPSTVQSAADMLFPGQGRLLSAGRQLADQRTPMASRASTLLFNTFSPVKLRVLDEKRQRADALRQLNAEIERYPGATGFETTSIPKEEVEQLPPEMRQYYELRQALQRKNQQEAKQKQDAAKRAARFGL
jgi:hypothetical protein